MSGEFKDFDAAWAEKQEEPIQYKIFGKTYDIPATISAAFMLEITKISSGKGAEEQLNAADIGGLLNALFGKQVVEDWLSKGMTLPQLNDVLQDILEKYGLTGGGVDPKAKAQQKDKSDKDK